MQTNSLITRPTRLYDPSVSLETWMYPGPKRRHGDDSSHMDLHTLGYAFQAIVETLLEEADWYTGLTVAIRRQYAVLAVQPSDPILSMITQPSDYPLKSYSRHRKRLGILPTISAGETRLGTLERVLLTYTGTEMPRNELCRLFYQAQKMITREDPGSRNARTKEIGIDRIVALGGQFQMRIDVYPPEGGRRELTLYELSFGLQLILKSLAFDSRWETMAAKVLWNPRSDELDGVLVADVVVERIAMLPDDDGAEAGDEMAIS